MSNYGVVSKGEYTYKQSNEFLHVQRFLIVRRNNNRFLLLDFDNKLGEKLTGIKLQIDQFDARGNSLGVVNAEFKDLKFGSGKFILKEKIALHRACLDFKVKILRAEYGNVIYKLGDNQTYSTYERKEVQKPIDRQLAKKQVGEEGYVATPRKFRIPAFVSVFAFILVLVAMAAMFLHLGIFSEQEDTFFISNLEYSFVDGNKDDGSPVYVTGAVGLGGKNIVVPSSIEGHPVQKISQNAFKNNTQIEKLAIHGDVLIENGAFSNCPNLTEVVLNGVTTIGQNAFKDCSNLKSFIATGARFVGNNALADCGKLGIVTFKDPANLPIVFEGAVFEDNSSIEELTIDQFVDFTENQGLLTGVVRVNNFYLKNYNYSMYEVAEYVQRPLIKLFGSTAVIGVFENVVIGYTDSIPADFTMGVKGHLKSFKFENLKESVVGARAFSDCSHLETVEFPIKITSLGEEAFKGAGIKEFDASSISDLGVSAFENCEKLKTFITSDNTPLKIIPTKAFFGCSALSNISIPIAVTEIGTESFKSSGLIEITFSENSPITTIRSGVFADCLKLKEIVLPNLVKTIEEETFHGCAELETIELSSMLENIGNSAFRACSGLEHIAFPSTLINIDNNAFRDCASLKEITLPEDIENLGVGVFGGCSSIEEITAPFIGEKRSFASYTNLGYLFGHEQDGSINQDNVFVPQSLKTVNVTSGIELADGVFEDCVYITEFNLAETIKMIGSNTFKGCIGIHNIELPAGLTHIQDYAFKDCINIRDITIPANVRTLSTTAFEGCFRLYEVVNLSSIQDVDAVRGIFPFALEIYGSADLVQGMDKVTIDGYVFAKTNEDQWYLVDGEDGETINLPSSVNGNNYRIPYRYFYQTKIVTVNIPATVEALGDQAFSGCASLASVVFGSSTLVIDMGSGTFSDCPMLSEFIMSGRSVDENDFSDDTFSGSNALSVLELPYGITSIREGVYNGRTQLTTVVLPSSVETIGDRAFSGCWSLSSVSAFGVKTLGEDAFDNCSSLKTFSFDSLINIGSGAFRYCNSLENVLLSSVESIGAYAFAYSGITNVDLSSATSLTEIAEGVFYDSGVSSVILPTTITDIKSNAFNSCNYLTNINLNSLSDLKSIGDLAFCDCGALNLSYIAPNTLTHIGSSAFSTSGLSGLSFLNGAEPLNIGDGAFNSSAISGAVTLPERLESISYSLFNNCTSLASVVIPSSIDVIEDYAFYGCTTLTSVVIPEGVTTIDYYSFYECSSLASVTIPASVTEIRQGAFNGCTSLSTINFVSGDKTLAIQDGNGSYDSPFGNTAITTLNSNGRISYVGNYAFNGITTLQSVDLTDVDEIGYASFSGCSGINSLTIDGVERISGYAFSACSSLVSVEISATTTFVGQGAFNGCSQLASLSLRSGDKNLTLEGGYDANSSIFGNTAITSFNANERIATIGSYAFYGVTTLTSVDLLGVSDVGASAFYDCAGIVTVTNVSNLERIENYAFGNCSSLNSFELSKLNYVGYEAFSNCSSLEKVTLGYNLSTYAIQDSSFNYCYNLHEVYNFTGNSLSAGDTYGRYGNVAQYAVIVHTNQNTGLFKSVAGDLIFKYNNSNTWLVRYIGTANSVTLGDAVTLANNRQVTSYIIASYAFYASSANEITLNGGVKAINNYAFNSNQNRIVINDTLDDSCLISDAAFSYNYPTIYYYGEDVQQWNDSGLNSFGYNYIYFYNDCVHEYGEWTMVNGIISIDVAERNYQTIEPTCTTEGRYTETCTLCSFVFEDYVIDKLPHKTDNINHDYYCEDCGYIETFVLTADNYDKVRDIVSVSMQDFQISSSEFASINDEAKSEAKLTINANKAVKIKITYKVVNGGTSYDDKLTITDGKLSRESKISTETTSTWTEAVRGKVEAIFVRGDGTKTNASAYALITKIEISANTTA